jgi:uncharacterized protein YraI
MNARRIHAAMGASATAVAATALILMPIAPAAAEPATTVPYPSSASATRYVGLAFDTCAAPSLSAMNAWKASPYRGVGVYIGGTNRTCAQPNLTSSWVSAVSRSGWKLIPIYMGLQAPCSTRTNSVKISAAASSSQGTSQAADAVSKAKALGMLPGSAIYADMEHYATNDTSCRTTVLRYLSAWTKELHRQGYLSGVYAHLYSGAKDLSDTYTSTSYARPDALWIARWDGSSSLTGWTGISSAKWANHQRGKQYRGDHNETHGGVTINIDNDRFDAPVATVAYSYKVTSSTALNARSGPSTKYPTVRSHAPGATLRVVCQTPGSKVGTTSVWDKLTDGTYVTDYYVSTPSKTTFSAPISRCSYPYQVTSKDALNKRTGPGVSYSIAGTLQPGALAWVVCQKAGSKVGTTSVWDKLDDGRWVSDYYVATPSNTSYSKPIPRC